MEAALCRASPQQAARISASCSSRASTSYAPERPHLPSRRARAARPGPCRAADGPAGGGGGAPGGIDFRQWTLANLLNRKRGGPGSPGVGGTAPAAARPGPKRRPAEKTDWDEEWEEDWDPQEGLTQQQADREAYEAYEQLKRTPVGGSPAGWRRPPCAGAWLLRPAGAGAMYGDGAARLAARGLGRGRGRGAAAARAARP
jgi:hypothetical protein